MDVALMGALGLVATLGLVTVWWAVGTEADRVPPDRESPAAPLNTDMQAGDKAWLPAESGRCQGCGVVNEPSNTYCRTCVVSLD